MKRSTLIFILLLCLNHNAMAWLGTNVPEDKDVIRSLGLTKNEEIDKDIINLFVWNMYKAEKEQWCDQFKTQIPNYDFFLLQEMLTKPDVLDIFTNIEDLEFTTATSFIYTKNEERTGVATGSKYHPKWSKFLRSEHREPILKTPKVTLFTKYSISHNDKELLIANIHAINFVSSNSLNSQLKEVAEVIKNHEGPVIFAGDFNAWTREKHDFLTKVINQLGMREVEFKNDYRKKIFGYFLDFIFVKGLEVIDSEVHKELNGSDHKAISAKLKIIKIEQ